MFFIGDNKTFYGNQGENILLFQVDKASFHKSTVIEKKMKKQRNKKIY